MPQQPTRPSRAPRAVRAAAVASSIVIVGLYIAYRSGGQTVLPGSKSFQVNVAATTNPTTAPTTAQAGNPGFQAIYSSKSAPVFKPEAFSGSKSGAVFHPSDTNLLVPGGQTIVLTTQSTTAPAQPAATQPALLQEPARQQQVAPAGKRVQQGKP